MTTYPLDRRELGGSSWVDRRLLTALGERHDVAVVSVTGPEGARTECGFTVRSAGSVPLEIRSDPARLARVAGSMLFSAQPYQARKFSAFPGWRGAAALLRQSAAGRVVIASGWPGLLLASAAGVPVRAYVAHNVESTIATAHAPWPLRLLGETWRMPRAERALLRYPRRVFTLSRTDATVLQGWGVPAEQLPVPLVPRAQHPTGDAVGFIGKASWPPNEQALAVLLGPVHEQLERWGVPVRLVLAGTGTEAHAGHPRVTALGRVADEADFYRRVGLVVVPRFGASTGISVKMLEAAEFGLPSVVPPELAAAVDPDGPWLAAADPDRTAAVVRRWVAGELAVPVSDWVRRQEAASAAELLVSDPHQPTAIR
ncbi:glycosyltransferase [Longimycelium tulufanense]|uniref:glycosyltransferase n=1 Tax=Longimycelium tulufanense TaxID=907463 RepID=UPI0016693923|nr:glycosyltransferase [Longimycelium tulufanense]